MSSRPLAQYIPLHRVPSEVLVDDDRQGKMVIDDKAMRDFAIQLQAMGSAQCCLDKWDIPKCVSRKAWLLSMMDRAFVHEQLTRWSGQRWLDLLKLQITKQGEGEIADQELARLL